MKPKRSTKRLSLARDLDKPRWRVVIVATLIIALFAMVSLKALELQVLDRERAFKIARQQHHGTSVQTYFFERAKEQMEKDSASTHVSADDFRYPGPRPRTRTSASSASSSAS